MSTYTESLGLELITPGSQAGLWGNTTNNTFNLIDQAITGVTPISFAAASGTTYTLTDYNGAEDEARSAVLNVTGTASGTNTIIIPNKQKTYFVRNSTGKDIIVQTALGTTPCTVGAGYNLPVFCDGNNEVFLAIVAPGAGTLTVTGGGTGVTTFGSGGFVKSPGSSNPLTVSSTVALGSEVAGTLPVANGGTGQTSLAPGGILFGNGTGAVGSFVGGASGQVATWNGSAWVAQAPASASGVTSFNGRTGAVTLASSDVTTALGYTPSNVSLSGTNTWSGTNTFTGTFALGGSGTTISGDGSAQIALNVGGVQRVQVYVSYTQINGDLTITGQGYKPGGGSWAASSDARLKENVTPLTNALDKIASLNPVTFNWKIQRDDDPTTGFIAQEVEQVMPSAIGRRDPSEDELKFVSDKVLSVGWKNDMIAYLVGAIKELKAEVDALKAAK